MDAEKWIKEHLDRLREETADWPTWMQTRMKPPRDKGDRRDAHKSVEEKRLKRN